MRTSKFTSIFSTACIAFLVVVFISPLAIFAASESDIITTREGFVNAINNAEDGDTILVGNIDFNLYDTVGAVNEGERIVIDKNITVKNGKSDSNAVFKGASFILGATKLAGNVTSFSFEGITFDEGLMTDSLTLEDWELSYDGMGAAISPYSLKNQYAVEIRGNAKAEFTDCEFKNYMHTYGPAIRAFYDDYTLIPDVQNEHGDNSVCMLTLTLNGCKFLNNAAQYDGGAIYIDACGKNAKISATDCTFAGNKSGLTDYAVGGGAVYLENAVSEFTECEFTDNQANYFYGADLPDSDSISGGAICCSGNGELNVRSSVFRNNTASLGGAIAIFNTVKARFESCLITENRAVPSSDNSNGNAGLGSNKGIGGAVYMNGNGQVYIGNTEICFNYAENALGAISTSYMPLASTNMHLEIFFTTIANNVSRLKRTDYLTYDNPNWIWYRYPGDVLGMPNVEMFGSFVADEMYASDIPKHELPTETNGYNYFGSTQNAIDDGFTFSSDASESLGHVELKNAPTVSTDLVREKLGEKNYYGDFTIGANKDDVVYRFFSDGECKSSVTLHSTEIPTLPEIVKKGYTLTSWTLDGEEYKSDKALTVGNATDSVDLYAVFLPNTYTVKFDFGNGNILETEQTYAEEIVLPEAIQRHGYTFKGWFTKEDGEGTLVGAGALLESDRDTTYYAYYKKDFPIAAVLIGTFAVVFTVGLVVLALVVFRIKRKNDAPIRDVTDDEPKVDTSMLSPREKEVLTLLEGKQRSEIATILYISENTVKKQITSIYSKLGVTTRSELFALFK